MITPDAKLLAQIESLQLNARDIAYGALAGMHRSQRKGSSIEFSEHQLYTPGDDIRHMDWRAFGKTDRLHIKQYEDETNLRLEILLDHSGSMLFGEPGKTKLDYAKLVAAALGYLALRQGDAVGLFAFSEQVSEQLPARSTSSHLIELLTALTTLQAKGKTSLTTCLKQFSLSNRRKSVVVILSDLFDPHPDLFKAIAQISARKHDVAVLQLLHPFEIDFSYDNPATFVSLEDPRSVFVHPRLLQTVFVEEMQKFLERTQKSLLQIGVDYQRVLINSAESQTLSAFLSGRQNRAKKFAP